MTIDEKLQHFYDASVEEAKSEASRMIDEHQDHLAKMFEEHKKTGRENADATLKAEAENARREINKALSSEQLSLKRDISRKQEALKETLFAEVKDRLLQFRSTPEYTEYLCGKIQEARSFAGEDELQVWLSPEDTDLMEDVSAKTGFPLQIQKDSFLGGIRAIIPAKNILIDNSFLGNYQAVRKEFQFDGGLNHE
jgi:vacuolar-type H+-ATPase subunit E/Vma4